MAKLSELEKAIRKSWDKNTCYQGCVDEWSSDNPAWGQCAVTALVVQDYLGGEIVWATVTFPVGTKASHYFNKINGEEYDLTREQFSPESIIPKGVSRTFEFSTTRDLLLSTKRTKERYEMLKQRVEEIYKP